MTKEGLIHISNINLSEGTDLTFVYQVHLLKGKFYDLSKKYEEASQCFEKALNYYKMQKEEEGSKEDQTIDGRLGNL